MKLTGYDSRTGIMVMALILGVVVCLWMASDSLFETKEKPVQSLDVTSLEGGGMVAFELSGEKVILRVPKGEGETYGNLEWEIPGRQYQSGMQERNGSIESLWIEDVSGDGKEDAILLIRSGGTGSYVDMEVLDLGGQEIQLRKLPGLPIPKKVYYSGHDQVKVQGKQILRSFPLRLPIGGSRRILSPTTGNVDANSRVRYVFDYRSFEWKIKGRILPKPVLKENPNGGVIE